MKEKNGGKLKKAIIIAVITVIVMLVGVAAYEVSPNQRAARVLAKGESYLAGLDYDQAFGSFKEAIDIAPGNEKIRSAIKTDIEGILTAADEARNQADYEGAIEKYDIVIEHGGDFDEELVTRAESGKEETKKGKNKSELLTKADQDFENGLYEDAEKGYEEAIFFGATEEEVNPRKDLCKIYQDIVNLCKEKDWDALVKNLDSDGFNLALNEIKNSAVTIGVDKDIKIMLNDGSVVLICGKLSDGSGNAVSVISSTNTYALYEGEWKSEAPEGKGELKVWKKSEESADAADFQGTYAGGLANGETIFSDNEVTDVSLSVSNGQVAVYKTDDKNRAYVGKGKDGSPYAAKNEKANGDVLDGYIAGVPGFGGSDKKLELEFIDDVPPELKCGLSISRINSYGYLTGTPYARSKILRYGITAVDNVDGNITDKITYTSQKSPTPGGYLNQYEYMLTVDYKVEDSAGNTAQMKVVYMYLNECGDAWYVMSVTHN